MTQTSALAASPTLALEVLESPVGNLDAYMRAVARMPMLTPEREQALASQLRDQNNLDAARELVMSHLRLVVSVSRQYLGYGLPQADLIQEGNIGLMKAVRRFDPSRGVRLVSFALHWIKAEIHEYIIRNWRLVKVATTKAQRKLFFNLRSLKGEHALTPERVEEIAKTLDVRTSDVMEMDTRMTGHEISLDPIVDDRDHDASVQPLLFLPAPNAEPTEILEQVAHDRLSSEGLRGALDELDERSRTIVTRRWLLDDGDSATLHELADEFGVSAERIRQIEVKALRKMRESLQAETN